MKERPSAREPGRGSRGFLRRWLLRSPRIFVTVFTPDDAELGALGEQMAAIHLAKRGWQILARRLRTRSGEADLVARRGSVLAIVEVKTGRTSPVPRPVGRRLPEDLGLRWRPGGRCDARRLARLKAVAREIAGADRAGADADRPAVARVDLIEVLLEDHGRRFRVLHHQDLRTPLVGAEGGT